MTLPIKPNAPSVSPLAPAQAKAAVQATASGIAGAKGDAFTPSGQGPTPADQDLKADIYLATADADQSITAQSVSGMASDYKKAIQAAGTPGKVVEIIAHMDKRYTYHLGPLSGLHDEFNPVYAAGYAKKIDLQSDPAVLLKTADDLAYGDTPDSLYKSLKPLVNEAYQKAADRATTHGLALEIAQHAQSAGCADAAVTAYTKALDLSTTRPECQEIAAAAKQNGMSDLAASADDKGAKFPAPPAPPPQPHKKHHFLFFSW